MNFLQEHLLVILTFGVQLLLLSGLLLAAIFRRFIPSTRWPSSKLVLMACWSFLGFVCGCCLAAIYWRLFERGWFDAIFTILPASWRDVQLVGTIVGGCWAGGLLGAWAGQRLWRRRLHARV